jgi:LPXTG-motif cell wall-anchored protein
MHEGSSGQSGEYPEAEYITQAAHQSPSKLPMAVGMSAGLLLIGAALMLMLRKRKTR